MPKEPRERDGIAAKLLRCGSASEALRRNMPLSSDRLPQKKRGFPVPGKGPSPFEKGGGQKRENADRKLSKGDKHAPFERALCSLIPLHRLTFLGAHDCPLQFT